MNISGITKNLNSDTNLNAAIQEVVQKQSAQHTELNFKNRVYTVKIAPDMTVCVKGTRQRLSYKAFFSRLFCVKGAYTPRLEKEITKKIKSVRESECRNEIESRQQAINAYNEMKRIHTESMDVMESSYTHTSLKKRIPPQYHKHLKLLDVPYQDFDFIEELNFEKERKQTQEIVNYTKEITPMVKYIAKLAEMETAKKEELKYTQSMKELAHLIPQKELEETFSPDELSRIYSSKFLDNYLKLNAELQSATSQLNNHKKNNPNDYLSPEVGRYKDIDAYRYTALGNNLNVNVIRLINGAHFAAGSFPKPEELKDWFTLLSGDPKNEQPSASCLVVINSKEDIELKRQKGEKIYFREPMSIDNIETKVSVTEKNDDNTIYSLTITNKATKHTATIPVLHIEDWTDRKAKSNQQIQELCILSRSLVQEKKPNALRFIHCNAGVGRTGQFIATDSMVHLKASPNTPQDTLLMSIMQMRESRNPKMVQTPSQLLALALLADREGIPII